jgi:spore coat polysaccharide biosynthesis protein SpsF
MNYCFIQARCASTRLPGKVLLPICGKPVLSHIVNRVSAAKTIDKIIVVTSTNPENDAIGSLCNLLQTNCFRGSEDDVKDRYIKAIEHYGIKDNDNIVRITGDCPLICPDIIDSTVSRHKGHLTTNCIYRTFPDGLDVEVFRADLLKHPDFDRINFFEKEYTEMDYTGFSVQNIYCDLSHLRWTLDTKKDFEFINRVYEKLYKPGQIFLMEDILKIN